ncbi:MAG TPA: flagellar biosynthesis protein FlhF, partial [Burkholderiaceae bacterium]
MNVRRFTARTSREALVLVRQVLGEDAVVLSTKPSVDGVEVLAMAPEGMQQIERMASGEPATVAAPAPAPTPTPVEDDVAQLSMSTLSFQDYVRER